MLLEAAFCLLIDTNIKVDRALQSKGMTAIIQAYSTRIKQPITIYEGDNVYAIVTNYKGKSCILDVGNDWREITVVQER